jgi:hypothetical protein
VDFISVSSTIYPYRVYLVVANVLAKGKMIRKNWKNDSGL